MKVKLILVALAGCLTFPARAQEKPKTSLDMDKTSYAIGVRVGANWKASEMNDIDTAAFLRGVQDTLAGKAPALTQEEMNSLASAYQLELQQRVALKRQQAANDSKEKGAKFLEENKTKPGVVTTASGLQYKIIQPGNGARPGPGDTVTANYLGAKLDGSKFDSSYDRGEPLTFQLNRVIKGWTEGIALMSVGAKWQFFVPSDLAYGATGNGTAIAPNETLLFEVELLGITPSPPPSTNAPQPQITSDIIRVPSAEEMKNGAQIETIKPEDLKQAK